jgi:hypothetical protein
VGAMPRLVQLIFLRLVMSALSHERV